MRRAIRLGILALCCAAVPLGAQSCPFNLDHIGAKAKELAEVTLDSATLQLAGRFLSSGKPEESDAKSLLNGVKAICVRNYEFAKPGEYTPEDLQRVRSQLTPPLWNRVVHAQEKNESSEVFTRTEGGKITGFAVIAAEAKELTVVYVDGAIDLDKLSSFGGKFGIPPIPAPDGARKPAK
ncbi:MAG TPA: DUF4252 domain-containing protein [Bryobacteraceae bacterium]|nr:DUF4252 domain-containing protein [Bryobacteraceae bacterium]